MAANNMSEQQTRMRGGKGEDGSVAQDLKIYRGNAGHYISPTARIFASPSPIGLYMFGLASAISAGPMTHWTTSAMNFVIFPFCFITGGIIPLIVGIWEIARNNLFAAVTFVTYGSFFTSFCLLGFVWQGGSYKLLPPTAAGQVALETGLQYALLMYAIITVIFLLLSLRTNLALTSVFATIALSFFCLAAGQTETVNATKAGGYFSIAVCVTTWYLATAELIYDLTGRALLPLVWYPWATAAKSQHAAIGSSRRNMAAEVAASKQLSEA